MKKSSRRSSTDLGKANARIRKYEQEVEMLAEKIELHGDEAMSREAAAAERERALMQELSRLQGQAGGTHDFEEGGSLYPWEGVTVEDLMRLFKAEARKGSLTQPEFSKLLEKLGMHSKGVAAPLFEAFDRNGDMELDFDEVFLGLALLLPISWEEEIQAAFMIMDGNGSGRVSLQEVEHFIRSIAPPGTARYRISSLATQILKESDKHPMVALSPHASETRI